jgi:hypothetical protein
VVHKYDARRIWTVTIPARNGRLSTYSKATMIPRPRDSEKARVQFRRHFLNKFLLSRARCCRGSVRGTPLSNQSRVGRGHVLSQMINFEHWLIPFLSAQAHSSPSQTFIFIPGAWKLCNLRHIMIETRSRNVRQPFSFVPTAFTD